MTFLKVMAFSLAVLLAYTLFANVLPQVQSDPPAEEKPVVVAGLDAAGLAAWGETLFGGKGTCTLCHNDLGRAPDLLAMDLKAAFAERLADPRYTGSAKGGEGADVIETYLRESLLEPSAFVVAGFGKKGSNDTVSPMPAIDKPPVSLSGAEINAVIAFLQNKAGMEVTVPLPPGGAEPQAPAKAQKTATAEEEETAAATAEAAIEKFTCNACHDLLGSGADVGPALAGAGTRLGREGIRRAVLDPNASVAKGYEPDMMPQDYGEQMRARELELVIDFLMALEAGG